MPVLDELPIPKGFEVRLIRVEFNQREISKVVQTTSFVMGKK